MSSTKRSISSQILRRLNSGDRSVGSRYDPREIDKAVEQVINSLIRPSYFDTLKLGESSAIEGCVLANYDNIAVVAFNGVSKSTLPAIPVQLPKNMGVYRISKSGDVMQNEFIPIPNGLFSYVVKQRMMSDLLGQIGFETRGKDIYYTKDLTALSPAITAVNMQLVVLDMSKYTDNELLPINADMEAQVVDTVYKQFVVEPITPQVVDPSSDNK